VHTGFSSENLREGDHLEAPGVDGRIILKLILERWYRPSRSGMGGGGDMDWIDLAQDRDRWQAVVNAVANLGVPQNAENFLSSCDLLPSQEGLCYVELVILNHYDDLNSKYPCNVISSTFLQPKRITINCWSIIASDG
jgi:hypothetical protein